MTEDYMKDSTICIHEGSYPDANEGGLNTPLYLSTAHLFPHPSNEIRYPRYSNTFTQRAPAEKIAALEHGEKGLVFSSGMAAITTVFLSLLEAGDHCVVQSDIYGGTRRFVAQDLARYGISVGVPESNDPAAVEREITSRTKLLYFETPSNPLLRLVDIEKIARIAGDHGLVSVIDNTFATPINQKPLDMGVDITVHSGTKYLGGHSDIACGAVVSSERLMERIADMQKSLGGSLDCFSCFLLDRGLKTLPLRVQMQNKNALTVARALERSDRVREVHYPGLESHPDHDLARRQMKGFGGIVAFTLEGTLSEARRFTEHLSVIKGAISLGGVESILCYPFETSHAQLGPKEREAMGITETTLRLSVGIEDPEDIVADIEGAFAASS
ncbi:MAG: aminotransferase class I/II-fold pyridoxal phosphate-dependent enzyme [Spirochaetes bacterium]|nr:aminotransferase class I/II-fold pyridoxal phosphate-dependent enzyme [Spirochaetota bacterium]